MKKDEKKIIPFFEQKGKLGTFVSKLSNFESVETIFTLWKNSKTDEKPSLAENYQKNRV